jgi:pSer/pThr/pTyr-binding forkhead associated (FHA) protein
MVDLARERAGNLWRLAYASSNAIQLDDAVLSRRQCILRITDDRVTVEDTRSTCGTYLDGRHTHGPTEVGAGSIISMGSTRIQVVRG